MNEICEIVTGVYAAGARLVVLDRFGKPSLGLEGKVSKDLKKLVRKNMDRLLEAVAGDPLLGAGWEARTALYRRALAYLDRTIAERYGKTMWDKDTGETTIEETLELSAARERSTKMLCRTSVADDLNEAWISGDFEAFRAALKRYVKTGLDAANGKTPKGEVVIGSKGAR